MAATVPDYVADPIRRCYLSLIASHNLLDISMRGINMVGHLPKMSQRIIDLTEQVGDEVTEELKSDLEESKRLAEFADRESKNGFPFLHAFAAAAAWGALEVTIEDILVGILTNEPTTMNSEEISKLRIPLAKYEEMDKEERMRFILRELGRPQTKAVGVSGFENILQVFALSGEVAEHVKKQLWELNHVRNVIVHRDSLADLRLVQACPWLNLKNGERVLVDPMRFRGYTNAIVEYADSLVNRLCIRYGVPNPRSNQPQK